MSLLDGVASEHFKTYCLDVDDSIVMIWKLRYAMMIPRHEAMRHFGTVGMMQIYFAKTMQVNAGRLEHEGIERAMFEVDYDSYKDKPYDTSTKAGFKIIKDSINVNQYKESLKRKVKP